MSRLTRAATGTLSFAACPQGGRAAATHRTLRALLPGGALARAAAYSTQPAPTDAAPTLPDPRPSLATESFNWQDPLDLSSSLTDDEKAIYEAARTFAQSELQPTIVEKNRQGSFDRGVMRAFGQMGLLGLTVPSEYGGGDAGYVAYGLAARAVEQVDSGYRSAMSVQSSLVMCAGGPPQPPQSGARALHCAVRRKAVRARSLPPSPLSLHVTCSAQRVVPLAGIRSRSSAPTSRRRAGCRRSPAATPSAASD